MTKALQLKSWA